VADRAGARDDVRMIVGGDDRQAPFFREATADRLSIFLVPIVEDDLRAVVGRRRQLYPGRIGGHDDDARNIQDASCQGHRLRVVAG